ncbi:hypothetical protein [Pelagibius sp. Alg239-R121]|uniref:hypothetical protein n=1 Tax=Pelagibius sp. Alg239-R121 TaxID=2993448 RepID=UPI0024A62405|nr:hypothetical protein [Pelagibius sp. Alg239-R121]
MQNAFNALRVRPVDVGGSIAKGLQARNAMSELKERGRLRDANAAYAESLSGGIPTDSVGRQNLVSKAAQVSPKAAFDAQAYLSTMDTNSRNKAVQEAGIIHRAFKDVKDPKGYEIARRSVLRLGIDDAPEVYSPKGLHEVLQAARSIMPKDPNLLSDAAAQQKIDIANKSRAPAKPQLPLSAVGKLKFDLDRGAISQGEYDAAVTKATTSTPLVSFGGEREKEEQKARGKRLDATAGEIHETARAAENTLAQLAIARTLDVRTGGLAPLKKWAASYSQSFGVDPSVWGLESASDAQAFEGIMNNIVLTKMQAQKGPQTENDAARIEQTLANLRNTPEANRFLFRSAEALARRDLEQARFFEDHYAKNRTYDGALRAWDKFKRETPLLATDPDTGQTIFFSEFERGVMRVNRGATRQQVVEFWRAEYGG